MMAALIAASLWLNLATWGGAPVSPTHAIVGGVMGAGIVAAGFGAVNWANRGKIALSWVISPLLGAGIAAAFLAFIKLKINDAQDKIAVARLWGPVLMGLMAGTFTTYLSVKGLRKIHRAVAGPWGAAGTDRGCGRAFGALSVLKSREPQEIAEKAVQSAFGSFGGAFVFCAWG